MSLILGCVLLFAGIAQAAEKPVIRIGARVFTEQTLLAEITSQYLRTKGYDTRVTGGLGSNLARSAQESGQLDLIWEYTGVSLVAYNHVDEKLDSEQSYARVKELDAKKAWSGCRRRSSATPTRWHCQKTWPRNSRRSTASAT